MDIGCYILYSNRLNKHYIGVCREDLALRIKKHNTGFYGKKSFTSAASDWQLLLFLNTIDYAHATRLEQKIKKMKSTQYIKNLIKYPELQAKIIAETQRT